MRSKLFVPNATVFIASFCIMVLELTASRIVARYLGSSLYTWTSVIGVVLGGIAIGNYVGGRIADRFEVGRALSLLFILASVSCSIVPVLNHVVGKLYVFWVMPWPLRVAVHVGFTFFLPSLILGMIAPVVAKLALGQGLATGRTIGNVYAWGAAGSIAGTFFTGFFLISVMGTAGVIWSVAGILAVIGIMFARRAWLPYLWSGVLAALAVCAMGSAGWAQTVGANLGLREEVDSGIIYQAESKYSYIEVRRSAASPDVHRFVLDQLVHSVVRIDESGDIHNLYPYQNVYEAVTRHFGAGRERLRTFFIGGGGYVFPRYIEKYWPGSDIVVVEIDPAVTEAAIEAFGLSRESAIQTHHLDAHNYIDNLLRRKSAGEDVPGFDFVYGDAVSGLSVPYQLTTYEFNEKIRRLLTPEGIYVINIIDSLSSGGRLLGAVLATLGKSFSHVYCYLPEAADSKEGLSNTFVVAASLREIDVEDLAGSGFKGSQLGDAELALLRERSGGLVLTDDYAPVENLLAPVVRQCALRTTGVQLVGRGNERFREGKLSEAIRYYRRALRITSDYAEAHNNLANVLARQKKLEEAVGHYQEALRIDRDFAEAHSNLAAVLAGQGKPGEAMEHYEEALRINPGSAETHYNMATVLANRGQLEDAIDRYEKALKIRGDFAEAYNGLGNAKLVQGDTEDALEHYRKALELRPDYAQVYNNVGAILARQGSLEEAIGYYRQALEANPEYEKARQNLNAAIAKQKELGGVGNAVREDRGI